MDMKQQLAIQAMYDAQERGELMAEPEPLPLPDDDPEPTDAPTRTDVARMSKARLADELARRGLDIEGRGDELRARLAQELFG